MGRKVAGVPFVLVLGLVAGPSGAAAQAGTDTAINAERLWLPAGPSHFVTLRSAALAPHLKTHVGASVTYQHRPIVLQQAGTNVEYEAVGGQAGAVLTLALGLLDRFQVGAAVPLTLVQFGVGTEPITTAGEPKSRLDVVVLRDLRFSADWRALGRREEAEGGREADGPGVLVSAGLAAPTGDEFVFGGDRGWVLVPGAAGDWRLGDWLFGLDLSGRIRFSTAELGTGRFASAAVLRAGAAWTASERLSATLEGAAIFELADQPEGSPSQHGFELGVGGRYAAASDYSVRGAFALGAGGLGAPTFRFVLGLEYGARAR